MSLPGARAGAACSAPQFERGLAWHLDGVEEAAPLGARLFLGEAEVRAAEQHPSEVARRTIVQVLRCGDGRARGGWAGRGRQRRARARRRGEGAGARANAAGRAHRSAQLARRGPLHARGSTA